MLLAQNGKALKPIVIANRATDKTKNLAAELASYLERISGAKFEVKVSDGSSGLAVGIARDFPALKLADMFASDEPFRKEEYLLRSHSKGVFLIGATEAAVEHAVWDFLHRLGNRQFFPGNTWEVVPENPAPAIAVDSHEKPDYYTRRIWYGHGLWDYNRQPYNEWTARNRAVQGFGLSTGHVYQSIIRRHADVFKAHPEYLGLVDGKRQGNKFCISNADLRKLVVDKYVLPYFRENPAADSISLEPSDGGGWCECEKCAAMGSISDRAVLLANQAATAMEAKYPDKYVGLLAYNQHSAPPSLRVHPKVLVKIQTAFIRGGHTFDELIAGWQKQGATIGVGEYYSVFLWDQSRPAAQRASDLPRIQTTLPAWHRQNARFFMAESSDNWGVSGLGYYLASRLLWDVAEAKQVDELVDDFFTKCFGPAQKPIREFYDLTNLMQPGDRQPVLRSDMVARMYRALAKARTLAGDDANINARINDLLLLTRYEELFQAYENADDSKQKKPLSDVIRHAYRMRETMMIHSKPISMRLGRGTLSKEERKNLEDDTPFDRAELDAILQRGVANTEVVELGFEPVNFGRDLVPATPLGLREVKPEQRGGFNSGAPSGTQTFYTWLDAKESLRLKISGGHIKHYRHLASNVQSRLFADANPLLDEPVAFDESVAPDGVERTVLLKTQFDGLHRLTVTPPTNRAKVDTVDANTPLTLEMSLDRGNRLTGYWSLYFYVPKGTKVVGGFATTSQRGAILDSEDRVVLAFSDVALPGYFKATVPAGQDGKLWKLHRCIGSRKLMTVPPFLARSSAELLLPREVVERDADAGAKNVQPATPQK